MFINRFYVVDENGSNCIYEGCSEEEANKIAKRCGKVRWRVKAEEIELPDELDIVKEDISDTIANYLSDAYGFLVDSYYYQDKGSFYHVYDIKWDTD